MNHIFEEIVQRSKCKRITNLFLFYRKRVNVSDTLTLFPPFSGLQGDFFFFSFLQRTLYNNCLKPLHEIVKYSKSYYVRVISIAFDQGWILDPGKREIYSYVYVQQNMFLTKHNGVLRRRYEKYSHIIQQLVFIEIHHDTKPDASFIFLI